MVPSPSRLSAVAPWRGRRSVADGVARGWLGQVLGEAVEHLAGAPLAQPRCVRPVDAVEIRALLRPGQRRAVIGLDELDRGDGDREAHAIGVHLVAVDEPPAGHDVVVDSVVGVSDALVDVPEPLVPADPEVELGRAGARVGLSYVPRVAPGVLGFPGGERREQTRWAGRVSPLDHERVVQDGALCHGPSSWFRAGACGAAGPVCPLPGWPAVSARYSPSRSSRRSTNVRRSEIHRSADRRDPALRLQVRVRPSFRDRTRPLVSRTCTCCSTAASDMDSGFPSSLTDAGPRLSRSSMRRRPGSASARKTLSRSSPGSNTLLSTCLSMVSRRAIVKRPLDCRTAITGPARGCGPGRPEAVPRVCWCFHGYFMFVK